MRSLNSSKSTDNNRIDLRSDAVTTPTKAMWHAMRKAELGWAPSGDDKSIRDLESFSAELVGKEAALFVPTGTMANLLALMTHTERGDQILLVSDSHIFWSEEWSLGYICGLVPSVFPAEPSQLQIEEIREKLSGRRFNHKPRTSLICLESPHNLAGGVVLPTDQIDDIGTLARAHGIPVHLDGARIFNGCAACAEPVHRTVRNVDTLMFCLNKGLSAPMGAMLCGPRSFVERSKTNLKRLGGHSIPQMGILAAAGTVALTTMLTQVESDNRRARLLAEGIESLGADIKIPNKVETNIVLVSFKNSKLSADVFLRDLAQRNVLGLLSSEDCVRFVTHRHIDDAAINTVLRVIRSAAQC
jgi:threonine aldolase